MSDSGYCRHLRAGIKPAPTNHVSTLKVGVGFIPARIGYGSAKNPFTQSFNLSRNKNPKSENSKPLFQVFVFTLPAQDIRANASRFQDGHNEIRKGLCPNGIPGGEIFDHTRSDFDPDPVAHM